VERVPTTNEWIKKIWYVFTIEYYLVIKKNETMSFFRKMDRTRDHNESEISQA
jgi:hypothetical protein